MRGRFEKPKQNRFGKASQPRTPSQPTNPGSNYGSGDFGDYYGSGNNMGGYSGYNGNYPPQNSYPPQNGYPSQNGRYPGQMGGYPEDDYPPRKPKGSIGMAILGFFLPLVGLILFLALKNSKPGKAKSAGKGALIGFITGVVLTIALVIAAVVGGNAFMNSKFDKVNQVEVTVSYTQATEAVAETEALETQAPETTEPPHVASREDYINFLVAGQSSRGAEDKEQARFADSMMLITLNTYEKTMTMTSLLRDTFVKMPDYKGHSGGRIKLTTVYHLGYVFSGNQIAGSMECMDMALYNNFGIEVDYNFEIDFKMFEEIINRLGGVTIVMDEAEANYMTKEMEKSSGDLYKEAYGGDFEAGREYVLDGFSSLAFARMRHAEGDGDSDIKRTSRQQRFVNALIGEMKTIGIAELNSIMDDVLPMVSTSMTSQQMSDMVKLLLPMLKDLKVVSGGTCPANYKGEMVDIYEDGMYHSVLKFNEQETKLRMRELTLGELPPSGVSTIKDPLVAPTDPPLIESDEEEYEEEEPAAVSEAETTEVPTESTVPADTKKK